jgi:hypothetical protein
VLYRRASRSTLLPRSPRVSCTVLCPRRDGADTVHQAEEASTTRDKLRPVAERRGVKARLWRLVSCERAKGGARLFFPERVIHTLRAQWATGGHDSDAQPCEMALLSAMVMPATTVAKDKDLDNSGNLIGNGFAPGPCTHG